MSAKRYTEEFKIEAVKQVTERGHAVAEVAGRLGVSTHSLYQWINQYSVPPAEREAVKDQAAEMRRLPMTLFWMNMASIWIQSPYPYPYLDQQSSRLNRAGGSGSKR